MFADKNGYILKAIGDDDIMEIAENQAIPLIEGSCRAESVIGTNAIGTPLYTGEPIYLTILLMPFLLQKGLSQTLMSHDA